MSDYIYGIHPVEEVLCSRGRSVERIWIQRGAKNPRLQKIIHAAKKNQIELCFEEKSRMDERVQAGHHQGVVALCSKKDTYSLNDLLNIPLREGEDPFFLILDHVEDPGNLGAVIRSAAAAGVHGVIVQNRGTAPLGAVAFKRSAGALEKVPVARVTNLVRAMESLKNKGIWMIGACAQSRECYMDMDFSGPIALVIGGERGLRRLVEETCDRMVSIPMKGGAESLNLSVAASLLLYEVVRKRRGKQK
ncbi:MAG: 23S rRNA (guanosine(2251)-2'-O)-methyltransferase RlmB [Nitrospirae bacterium CG_4_9_14_3_um_filter_53_35]|nr:MAG: 23S rRNA (guanosine(2251)-2'-O)-methyltransferase RlmB [Nitrospirae bacterium CG2_30_53_67]PIS36393.1 MAG: 23S rRNA (guanosine(2251)-2'-O)-methyltransferase RlmB [Nitrospirae bacterium CG08_land_8_20_14_0_20_52_24]PIV84297.1 MAG: 23S rRNA (guanosine(2251)-2'-O)-methyltransferase RlmB [Nitrospirae bacterium CG17_big_fil_post_rev_8_21_14_2_50_50_9]PIW85246.1 MAG: 23S rRNA (guanosine(2251)-2'-O)-methyltransferase RlmB [Nitrospirae bacterium CG_4_8_14_3_um_filter_50_41]PIX86381.1 MAG: 23S r